MVECSRQSRENVATLSIATPTFPKVQLHEGQVAVLYAEEIICMAYD